MFYKEYTVPWIYFHRLCTWNYSLHTVVSLIIVGCIVDIVKLRILRILEVMDNGPNNSTLQGN